MRVLLDTNVLVAAFATRGLCADLLRAVLSKHELVVVDVVRAELERVLRDKLQVPEEIVVGVLDLLEPYRVALPEVTGDGIECRDPDDRLVLACALAANVDALVTEDQDLLVLTGQCALCIVDPRGLWNVLRESARR